MQSDLTDYLTWRVIVSNAATFIKAYDETDPIKQQHNGDPAWAKIQIQKIVSKANALAPRINGQVKNSPAYLAPTATTVYCAARLQEIEPTFCNVLTAGITKTEPDQGCSFFEGINL